MLYPEALTHDIQLVLGVLVLMVNLMIYGWLWRQGGGPEPGRESGWNPRFLTPLTESEVLRYVGLQFLPHVAAYASSLCRPVWPLSRDRLLVSVSQLTDHLGKIGYSCCHEADGFIFSR